MSALDIAQMVYHELLVNENPCCLCDKEFSGYGNNPAPFKGGRCCDDCNGSLVLPARFAGFTSKDAKHFLKKKKKQSK
jgi:hypothetical protein